MGGYTRPFDLPRHLVLSLPTAWQKNPFFGSYLQQKMWSQTFLEAPLTSYINRNNKSILSTLSINQIIIYREIGKRFFIYILFTFIARITFPFYSSCLLFPESFNNFIIHFARNVWSNRACFTLLLWIYQPSYLNILLRVYYYVDTKNWRTLYYSDSEYCYYDEWNVSSDLGHHMHINLLINYSIKVRGPVK